MKNWVWVFVFFISMTLSLNLQAKVTVFKIGQPPLGHCTGFQIEQSSLVFTAGHCNKPGDTPILEIDGQVEQSLPVQDKAYFVHPMGVVDAMILGEREQPSSANLNSAHYQLDPMDLNPGNDFFVVGYSQMLRDNPEPTMLHCQPLKVEDGFGLFGVEKSLGTLHLKCPQYEIQGEVFSTKGIMHRDVAGMSGGPVFYKGQLMGVIYHFDEVRNVYKVQILNSQLNVQTAQSVQTRFQLNKKLFEEVKVPNTVNIHMDRLLWENGLLLLQREMIQNINLVEEQVIIQFKDGEVFRSQRSPTSTQARYIQFVKSAGDNKPLTPSLVSF